MNKALLTDKREQFISMDNKPVTRPSSMNKSSPDVITNVCNTHHQLLSEYQSDSLGNGHKSLSSQNNIHAISKVEPRKEGYGSENKKLFEYDEDDKLDEDGYFLPYEILGKKQIDEEVKILPENEDKLKSNDDGNNEEPIKINTIDNYNLEKSPVRILSNLQYKVGSKGKARYDGGDDWYKCTILNIRPDGRLQLEYDDGDIEDNVIDDFFRLKEEEEESIKYAPLYQVGDRGEGNYNGMNRWNPCVIVKVNNNGTYKVQYDKNELEDNVLGINFRQLQVNPMHVDEIVDTISGTNEVPEIGEISIEFNGSDDGNDSVLPSYGYVNESDGIMDTQGNPTDELNDTGDYNDDFMD